MFDVLAAEVAMPWPLVWLIALTTILAALGSGYVVIRGSGTKARIEMLQGERDDWRQAKHDGDEELAALRAKHERVVADLVRKAQESEDKCAADMAILTSKVEVLENVVSGASAIKDMTQLILTASEHQHQEVLGAIHAMNSSVRSFADGVWSLLGQGDRRKETDI